MQQPICYYKDLRAPNTNLQDHKHAQLTSCQVKSILEIGTQSNHSFQHPNFLETFHFFSGNDNSTIIFIKVMIPSFLKAQISVYMKELI